jgi:hypothetical protein
VSGSTARTYSWQLFLLLVSKKWGLSLLFYFLYGIVFIYMDPQKSIDFDKIDWSKIGKKKAKFIYDEAIARLDAIHKSNEGITNKAISMLSFSLPVLTAFTGYLILQWESITIPSRAMSICSIVSLVAILVLLLLILLPKGINTAQGEPSAYFTDDYYKNSMTDIFKGNIQTLHQYINDDYTIQETRANLFKAAILLFAIFPIISTLVWGLASLIAKPCP